MDHFTQMEAWQEAMNLAEEVHMLTKSFPKDELYGVVSQLRRAALSVAANIAEGFGRYTFPDKKHKYVQARGELVEVITIVMYCRRVKYISKEQEETLLKQAEKVHKLLNGLITKIRSMASHDSRS